MKKLLYFILLLFMLAACKAKFDGDTIRKGVDFCEPHGGVFSFHAESFPTQASVFKCNDKSTITIFDLLDK